ncbi:coiled-coil domain-containing protein 18-like [Branchiostoma floridae x Branchiostoma belcheri]
MSSDEEILMRNVSDLRKRLQQTEQSLRRLDTAAVAAAVDANGFDDLQSNYSSPERLPPLTLEDLTPDPSEHALDDRGFYSNHDTVAPIGLSYGNVRADFGVPVQRDMPSSARSRSSASSFDMGDGENELLRKKLAKLRQENTQLISQNHKLHTDMENTMYQLHQANNKMKILTMELEAHKESVPSLEDKVVSLEAEVTAHDKALRDAEERLDEVQRQLSDRERDVKRLQAENKSIKADLLEETGERKRSENQRDEALQRLEELSEELEDYRSKVKEKLKKHQSTEEQLRDSLLHSDRERGELLDRAASLEGQVKDLQQQLKRLQNEGTVERTSKTDLESQNLEMQRTVSRQAHRINRLESDLGTKEQENTDLKLLSSRQKEKLAKCQYEVEQSQSELRRLEAMVQRIQEKSHVTFTPTSDSGFSQRHRDGDSTSPDEADGTVSPSRATVADLRLKLAMKEAEIQKLQASLASLTAAAASGQREAIGLGDSGRMDGLRKELTAIIERSRLGDRKSQELEHIIGRLEDERSKHASKLLRLEEQIADKTAQAHYY